MQSRWYQFRLRTMLWAVLAISLPLAWGANAWQARRAEQALIARLESQNIQWQRPLTRSERQSLVVSFLCPTHWEDRVLVVTGYPSFLSGLGETVNMQVLQRVKSMELEAPALDDDALLTLTQLPYLQKLQLRRGKFTSAGIDQFRAARPDVELEVWCALAK